MAVDIGLHDNNCIFLWKDSNDKPSASRSSGGSRKFERGVHSSQLNRRGFTTPINYNVHLLASIRVLFLADVSLMHFTVR